MTTPRDQIRSVRDFEQFLRKRGFSRTEAKALAGAYRRLAYNSDDCRPHVGPDETDARTQGDR